MNKLVFDIGASNIKYAVMTENGEILSRSSHPTPRDNFDNYFDTLEKIANENKSGVDAIAMSTNGRMRVDGDTYRAYTADFLIGVNLREEMEKRTGLPVSVENDGFSSAIGEWWKGAGRGSKNMLAIVLGSGMGGGLILNGKPYRGSKLNSAMVFCMISSSDIDMAKYRASGVETAFLMLLYMVAMGKQMNIAEVTGQKVFEWAAAGDKICLGALEKYYRAVAVTIFNSAALLDLDCVVITGGLAGQAMVIEGIKRNLEDIAAKLFQIEGIDTSALGVALDGNDIRFDVRAGELTADANLYGALYKSLNGAG